MANPKLELNLSEESDISFSLKIQGSDKDIGNTKPKIRFTITEAKTGRGWIFNAQRGDCDDDDDNGIHVSIPDMKTCGVMEGEKYDGKLEVIMGTRFFTPTEVDIEFIEPLKVEAAITARTGKETLKEEVVQPQPKEQQKLSIESEIATVTVTKKKPAAKPVIKETPKRAKPVSYKQMKRNEQAVVNKIFVAECKKAGIDRPRLQMKEGTDHTKKQLKGLFKEAVKRVNAKRTD